MQDLESYAGHHQPGCMQLRLVVPGVADTALALSTLTERLTAIEQNRLRVLLARMMEP